VECLLIADDLTGACDAAVQFAAGNRRVSVALNVPQFDSDADFLAISTESRGLPVEEARRVIIDTARRLTGIEARILFKKIDSTWRGNAGAEIAATMEAFGCDAAVITPAFPAMKRLVKNGCLHLDGDIEFQPLELAASLREQGLVSHRHVGPGAVAAAIGGGARYVSLDAVCDADLDRMVETILESKLESKARILWAGSAGLAAALARSISAERTPIARPADPRGPVLFCIGSTHPATVAQQRRLLSERPVCALSAETARPAEIADALRDGDVMLETPRGRIPEARLAELLRGVPKVAGALALSGGDTASHVCRSLHVDSIELHDEIEAGIPWGTLHGGVMDGIAVATKSGAFGDSGALIDIADFFP
jgi:uncharacterized protein YgbK (DUF1537 family)